MSGDVRAAPPEQPLPPHTKNHTPAGYFIKKYPARSCKKGLLILLIHQCDKNHIAFPGLTDITEIAVSTLALAFFKNFDRISKFRKSKIMGNNKQPHNKSRRSFLSGLLNPKKEKVKMLTADGKLVEIDKDVLDAASKQKTTNKDILQWMNNPSKNENDR